MQKYFLCGFLVLTIIIGIFIAMKLMRPHEEDLCRKNCISKEYFDGACHQLSKLPQPCENEHNNWITNDDPANQLCKQDIKTTRELGNFCCCMKF